MPNKYNNSKRHYIPKQQYKLINWPEYNTTLKKRGRLDIFMDEKVIEQWSKVRIHDGQGSTRQYFDVAILTCHRLRMVFHLPLRQTQGFVESIFGMMKINLPVPSISTLCDRLKTLGIDTPEFKNKRLKTDEIFAIAIASTEQ